MGIVSHFLKQLKTIEVTASEYPALFKAVEDLASKAGFKEIPKLHIIHHPMYSAAPLAGVLGPKDIILNTKLMKILESDKHVVSEEMKAVIGHEMSHMKNNLRDIGCTRLPVLLGPMAATLGYYFYRKASKKANSADEFHKNLEHIVTNERKDAAATTGEGIQKHAIDTSDPLIVAAKYAAVAIAGLGAGLIAARQFSKAFEYAADKHGAKLVSPEAMASALTKLHGDFEKMLQKNPKQPALLKLLNETILAHPSLDERVSALGRL